MGPPIQSQLARSAGLHGMLLTIAACLPGFAMMLGAEQRIVRTDDALMFALIVFGVCAAASAGAFPKLDRMRYNVFFNLLIIGCWVLLYKETMTSDADATSSGTTSGGKKVSNPGTDVNDMDPLVEQLSAGSMLLGLIGLTSAMDFGSILPGPLAGLVKPQNEVGKLVKQFSSKDGYS